MLYSGFTRVFSQLFRKNFNIHKYCDKQFWKFLSYKYSDVSCSSYNSCLTQDNLKHVRSMKYFKQQFTFARCYCQQAIVDLEPVKKKRVIKSPVRRERKENQEFFLNIISEKGENEMSADDWSNIKILLSSKMPENWEIFCMHTLYMDKNVRFGKSLMNYLESQSTEPNLIVMTFYIGLLGQTCHGSDEQEAEVKKYFDILLSKMDILDAASIEVLIGGLSKTKYYQECLPLLKLYEEFNNGLGSAVLAALLDAGMRYKNSDLANYAMSQYLKGSMDPTQLIMHVPMIVESCLDANNQQGLEDLMGFIRKHMLLIPKTALDEILNLYQRFEPGQWTGNYGYIHYKGGNCVVCGTQMDRIEVSQAEFEKVQKVFLDQVIVGRNIFYKSTPEEMKNLIEFVKNKGPFDVVIDGLNVVHHIGAAIPQIERLEKTVNFFLQRDKKVLLLGSKVLARYSKNLRAMRKLNVYMTSTTKADDVFMIYAALQSGRETLIVSHDKLRDHRFLLDSDIRHIFNKWLHTIQIYDWFYSRQGEFTIRRRHLFDLGPKKDDGGWHLPENDIDADNPHGQFRVLCLRHISKLNDGIGKKGGPPQINKDSLQIDQEVGKKTHEKNLNNQQNFQVRKTDCHDKSVLSRANPNPNKKTSAKTKSVSTRSKDKDWFTT